MAASPTTNISFQNFFSAQLTADITASDVDIPMDAIPNGSEGFLVIEPDSASKREVIYYTSKTALKVVCPSAGDGRGQDDTSATTHANGSTVIMAPIAAYFELLLSLFTTTPQGWTALSGTFSVASGYNAGNKSYVIDTSTDQSAILSPGMRFKLTRGTTAPTQCADFESGSSHYANDTSVSGWSFTDDITTECWLKVESYPTNDAQLIGRGNGSTAGFSMYLDADGTIVLMGLNTTYERVRSNSGIPLGEWVHVAATLDLSGTTGSIYFNGISQAFTAETSGNISAFTNSGDINLGRYPGANYYDGEISDVRVWSAVRTQTQIRDNMHQQLVGNESNLVGYWKLNGNFTDSTSNGNDLSAQNSAAATAVDHPFKDIEYGIITKVTSTQVTVFTGTGYGIPNMTLNSPNYSTFKTPFGFPSDPAQWTLKVCLGNFSTTTSDGTYVAPGNQSLTIPIGAWQVSWEACLLHGNSSASIYAPRGGLSTANNASTDEELITGAVFRTSSTSNSQSGYSRSKNLTLAAATAYYMVVTCEAGAGTRTVGITSFVADEGGTGTIRALCGYL